MNIKIQKIDSKHFVMIRFIMCLVILSLLSGCGSKDSNAKGTKIADSESNANPVSITKYAAQPGDTVLIKCPEDYLEKDYILQYVSNEGQFTSVYKAHTGYFGVNDGDIALLVDESLFEGSQHKLIFDYESDAPIEFSFTVTSTETEDSGV